MKTMKTRTIITIIFSALIVACSPYKNLTNMKSMKDMDYGFKVNHVELSNEINIAYVDEGTGNETIILIHGLGSYIPAWKKNITELSKKYRCIAIDLPGYGKSSKNPHSGLMTFYAGVVNEFIDKLGLENVTLAGHSMGGQISMVAAIHYPEKVKNLILVDPAGFENFHPGQRLWFKDVMSPNLVRLTSVESIEVNLASNFYNMPKDAMFMIEDRIAMRTADDFENYCYAVSQSVGGMVDEPVLNKLKYIKQPTLIFFGENDNLIPNRYLNPGKTEPIAKFGASKIQNSKLIMVPKCGHFMMFEKSETFNFEVANFLK
jgi:pimeloyl-ACP methyl ester carboxylesterase